MSALSVVLTGSDTSPFQAAAASDTLDRLRQYAAALNVARPGSQLTYLSLGASRSTQPIELPGLRIIPVSGGVLRARRGLYRWLVSQHRLRPIDVVATQTPDEEAWVALAFARRRHVPVVAQIHYDLFSAGLTRADPLRRLVRSGRRAVSLRLLRRCSAVRVVGQEVAKALQARNRVPPVHVVPVPTVGPVAPARRRAELVIFVGRLAPEKRLDVWLEVAARVAAVRPASRFEIIGDGPSLGALRLLASKLLPADRVTFRGAISPQLLAERYAEASVLLLTSAHEGFGRVLVEAGRAGLPVVTTDIPGPRDIVLDGETGFVCRSVVDMANAVASLLASPEDAGRMGRKAAEHMASRFDPATLVQAWVSLLIDVAEGRKT